jgi:Mrp family chromosome partitioning ATPase
MRAWRSCWPLAFGVALLTGGAIAVLADFQQPRILEAIATVRVVPPAEDPQLSLPAQLHHLRDLAAQPQQWLGGEAHPQSPGMIIAEGEGGVVEVRLRGRDSGALERQVSTVVALHQKAMAEQQAVASARLTAELESVEASLKGVPALPRNQQEAYEAARAAAERAEKHRRVLEAELADFKKQSGFSALPIPPEVVEKLLLGDPTGAQLLEARATTLANIAQVKRVANPSTLESTLRPYLGRLEKIDEQIIVAKDRVTRPLREQARARWDAEYGQQLTRLTEQLTAAKEMEEVTRKHLESLSASPVNPGAPSLAERTRLEDRRQQLAADVRKLAAGNRPPGGFEVVSETTREVSTPTRLAGTLAAGLLGGLGFGAIVVARQRVAGKVRSARELAETTGLQVLGRLPLVSGNALPIPGVRPPGIVGEEVQRLEEAADQIRGPVLRQAAPGPIRLLVTSAGPADGRTTLATQLATSLARAGKRVLLVDGSLDRPDLAWLFQLNPEPGLAEVLRGELEMDGAMQPTAFSRLGLLPAGHACVQARAALVQDWSAHLFEPILADVDVVIIDGPAMNAGPEASAWAAHCQAVLVAVRADHTPLAAAHDACHQLHLLQVPLLGLVILERGRAGERASSSGR